MTRPLFSRLMILCSFAPLLVGCSIKSYALRATADALSGPGSGFGEEADPELARDAAPFALKTLEQLSQAVPDHQGLYLSLAGGFVQYAYAFVQQDADRLEDKDIKQWQQKSLRARRLYLRGRDNALGGLERRYPGCRAALLGQDAARREACLQKTQKADVPYLYWAAAGWALAVSTAKDQPALIGDLPVVESLMNRALKLDESFDQGSIHEFYVTYDAARDKSQGGGPEAAKRHLDRALLLNHGRRIGPLVAYAEGVLVAQQNKAEFLKLLTKVVETDVYVEEEGWRRERLANIINQERARWLLSRTQNLFLE